MIEIILENIIHKAYAATTATETITQIAAPLVNLFNMLLAAGAFVFMIMLFYTAFKFAIAQGDPKGIMGAKETFKFALFGFIVTIGSFTIIALVSRAFGIDESIIENPGGASQNAIQELINFIDKY